MKRLLWATDIHLNSVDPDGAGRLLAEVRSKDPDAVLIGGDIGEADSALDHLKILADELDAPIYFVLGNHDYYWGSIAEVRAKARRASQKHSGLHYLPAAGVVEITNDVGLVGHGGWADGRFGDFRGSDFMLTDYVAIDDLAGLPREKLWAKLKALGDEAASTVGSLVADALARFPHVFFLTHVPPFLEAAVHEGKPCDDDSAPHFSCKAVGDKLLELMARHPDRRLIVLCGHTHGEGHCHVGPDIEVFTGGAEYGHPSVQRCFELDM